MRVREDEAESGERERKRWRGIKERKIGRKGRKEEREKGEIE
jgi:hypothetical protein